METGKIKPLALEDISRYKNEIYGVGILWIMLFHAIAILKLDYAMGYSFLEYFNTLIGLGNMGVEIFLFCSGVFLYFSYYKQPNLLAFMKKRMSRLLCSVFLITGWYWAWIWIFEKKNPAVFITKMTALDFWLSGNQQIWFVAFIFICYLLYPYVHAYLFESKFTNGWIRLFFLLGITAILTLALKNGYPELYDKWEIALTRFPVFFIGCFVGKFVYEKKTMPWWTYIVCILLSTFTFCILQMNLLSGIWRRWFYLVGGIPLTIVIVLFFNILKWPPIRTFFAFFGKISLNLYISHILVIRLYKLTPFYADKNLFHYLIILLISIIVAWLAELAITRIFKQRVPSKT